MNEMMETECLVDPPKDWAPPLVPPEEWFFAIPDGEDPRLMAQVGVCGADAGRFWSLLGEPGVDFTFPYQHVDALPARASSYYMNERPESPVTVERDGKHVLIPAGGIGWGHSPDEIETTAELFDWHDNPARVRVKARLIETTVDGKTVWAAAGALMPDATLREAMSIVQGAEVSPEFWVDGDHAEILGLSLVPRGNSNTTLRAEVRGPKGGTMPCACDEKTDDDPDRIADAERRAAEAEERAAAAEAAAGEAQTAALAASTLTQMREALHAAAQTTDTDEALADAAREIHDGEWVWVESRDENDGDVIICVSGDDIDEGCYRHTYTANGDDVTLSAEFVEVEKVITYEPVGATID